MWRVPIALGRVNLHRRTAFRGFERGGHEKLVLQLVKSRVAKCVCIRIGYGPIGKGAEERGLHLIPFAFRVAAISKGQGIVFEVPQLTRLEIFCVLRQGV
jgi:hypothetical protein